MSTPPPAPLIALTIPGAISEARVRAVVLALPEHSFIRQYVIAGFHATDGPLVYHIPGALCALAAVAPTSLLAHESAAMTSFGTFWGLSIGTSGERKSSCLKIGRDLVGAAWKERLGSVPGSPEGLAKSLLAQPSQILYYQEFGSFLSATAPGSYLSALREKLTEAYDCAPISVRLSKQDLSIENPRLSLQAATTPEFLEDNLTYVDWKGGFMGRMAYFVGQRERTWSKVNQQNAEKAAETATETFKGLIGTELTGSGGKYTGRVKAAEKRWEAWFAELATKAATQGEWFAVAAQRTSDVARKAALLCAFDLGVARTSEPWQMPLVCLEFGIQVGEMHAESLAAILSTMAANRYERDERNVLRAIGDRMATWDEIHAGLRPRMIQRDLDAMLGTLVMAKKIVRDGELGSEARWAKREQAEGLGMTLPEDDGVDHNADELAALYENVVYGTFSKG